jgi:hypothetical protein
MSIRATYNVRVTASPALRLLRIPIGPLEGIIFHLVRKPLRNIFNNGITLTASIFARVPPQVGVLREERIAVTTLWQRLKTVERIPHYHSGTPRFCSLVEAWS